MPGRCLAYDWRCSGFTNWGSKQQTLAYREMTDDDLFTTQWVKVELPPEEFPGYKVSELFVIYAAKELILAAKSAATAKCCAAAARENCTTNHCQTRQS